MGKKSSPEIPEAPSFQPQANVNPNIRQQSSIGAALSFGGFLPDVGPSTFGRSDIDAVDLSFLEPLVTLNPEVTQQAFGLASRDVERVRDRAQQDVLNQLEANNQLTSSTTANRLSDLNEAFSADIADIATTLHLADVERALGNTAGLFELGLNTTGNATSAGLQEQQQRNSFALQNHSNQIAASLASQSQSSGGGLLGGGLGTVLGATGGFLLGGPAGAAIGGGLGGSVGAGIGGGLFPAQGTVDPGLGFIGGGASLAGLGLGSFTPTSTFASPSGQADLGLNERLALLNQRALGGSA